ncbi:hypothetical protein RCG17_23875 [Neobacillus sp. PS3-12]|nr:hypothetical protein [Neobacillus sp. PS3-12]WML55825.1 hypothetical protein RCG17_23875 [Neobacillus sp. PS3-12]
MKFLGLPVGHVRAPLIAESLNMNPTFFTSSKDCCI